MTRLLPLAGAAALILLAPSTHAQLLEHVAGGVGPNSIVGNDVAIAADGSHYMAGTFAGTATFDAVSITAWAGSQWSDAFLVKHDSEGEALWARRGGTNLWNDMGNAVAVGSDGSVYWVGAFTAQGVFDGGENPDLSITNVADWDVFVAKYDAAGNIQWLNGLRGAGQNIGQGVAVDNEGNVYVVGLVRQTATIDDVTLESAGSSDAFVVKLDADGEAQWGLTMGGIDGVAAYEVDRHPAGGVVVSGQFRGVAMFGDTPMQSAGLNDTYAARIASDGEVLWASQIGAGGDEFNRGVAVAADGAVYLTGSFEQQMLIGTDILTSAGASDVYVVKLNPDGTPVWGRRAGGGSHDFGEAVAVDHEGNVYATGYVDGSGTFSTEDEDVPYATAGFSDAYLVVYSPEGDLLELELVGHTNVDRGSGVAVNSALGRLAISGFFRSSLTVGNTTVQGVSGNEAFIAFGNTIEGQPPVGSVVFVNAEAAPDGDGQSWGTAFADLQDALSLARDYPGAIQQIWVAEGMYLPTADGDRAVSFDLVDGVDLIGGFAGDESSADDRPHPLVHSVLGGNIGDPDADQDNSLHVITSADVFAIVDGFEIRDAFTNIVDPDCPHYPHAVGGGLRVDGGGLILRRIVVANNHAGAWSPEGHPPYAVGGGIYLHGGTHVITESTFFGNRASGANGGSGGGLAALDGAHVDIYTSQFANNSVNGNPSVSGGGAIAFMNASFHIEDVLFQDNLVLVGAAGGGAVLVGYSSEGAIVKSDFVRNTADSMRGGGVFFHGIALDIINSRFLGNTADAGGAIANSYGELLLVNSLFVGNTAESPEASALAGGGSIHNTGYIIATNSTFVFNESATVELGQDIRTHDGGTTHVRNTILWPASEHAAIVHTVDGETDVNRALVRGGYPGGTDVITGNPLFTQIPDPGADGQWGTKDDDYGDLRLLQGSPAIDFGLTDLLPPDTYDLDGDGDTTEPIPIDLAGEARVQGNEVDLGAYESPFAVSEERGPGGAEDRLDVYPNPTRDAASIDLLLARDYGDLRVELFDLIGRRVAIVHDGALPAGLTALEIDARALPAGLYFVRVIGEGMLLPAASLTVVR